MTAEIYQKQGHDENLAIAKKNLGETWIKLNNREKAADYLNESYLLYQNKDFLPKQLELYPILIDNLEALGHTAKALKLMREYKQLNDEMVTVGSKSRISELQTAFDIEKNTK